MPDQSSLPRRLRHLADRDYSDTVDATAHGAAARRTLEEAADLLEHANIAELVLVPRHVAEMVDSLAADCADVQAGDWDSGGYTANHAERLRLFSAAWREARS
jgi:hypothetical protein